MDPVATHQPLLVAAMLRTQGPILELGGGNYSTQIVAPFADIQRRECHTVETGAAVYQLFLKHFQTEFHRVWFLDGYNFSGYGPFVPDPEKTREQYIDIQSRFLTELTRKTPRWSVVFVDQAPGFLRVPAIRYFANSADYIVIHDTEMVDAYGFEPCLSEFTYRWEHKTHPEWTTVVSNSQPCADFAGLLGIKSQQAAVAR